MNYSIVGYMATGEGNKMDVWQLSVPQAMCLELYAGISEGLDTYRFFLNKESAGVIKGSQFYYIVV